MTTPRIVTRDEEAAAARDRARPRLALWAVVGAALVPVAAFVVLAAQRVGYPYELQWFEGGTVEVSARVAEGLPLYGPPTTEFTPWPYPPLYFWVTGELAKLSGVNLSTLRAVSLAATLVSLVLLVLIVRSVTRSLVAGVVAAGVFAATYRVSGTWFDSARIDSLFLALALAALLVGLRARTWRGGLAVGGLFLLAFLTKQNALIVAAPILGWLLWRRRPVGLAAAGGLSVGAVASLVLGDVMTGGWYSRYVATQLLGQGAALQWVIGFWVVDLLIPFALLLGAWAWWQLRQRRRGQPLGPLAAAERGYLFAGMSGLALASWAGRLHDGGYANNAIPAHAGMALLLGLAAARVLDSAPTTRLLCGGAAVLLVQAVGLSVGHGSALPTPTDRLAGDRFIAQVENLPGRTVIASHPYYLRLAGRATHASAIAVDDLLDTRPGPARDAMTEQLPWSLTGVDSVILDHVNEAALFGDVLARDFTLVSDRVVPGSDFVPVSDVATKPALLYVRTSVLPR